MTIAYAEIGGRILIPGTEIGIHAEITATPETVGSVLTFPGGDALTVGPVFAWSDPTTGVLTPPLRVPIAEGATGVVWSLRFRPMDARTGLPSWTRRYLITAAGRLEDLVETVATAVAPDVILSVITARDEAVAAAATATELATSDGQTAANVTGGPLTGAALSATFAPKAPTYTFLVSGTSQAVGVGTSNPPSTAYPTTTKTVTDAALGITTALVNGGESGKQSDDLLATLPGKLAANAPSVVVLELPINDVRTADALTTAQTIENMSRMAALVRLAGAEPIFLTGAPINPTMGAVFGYGADFTDAGHVNFAAAVKALNAKGVEMGIRVADTYNAVKNAASTLPTDGIHYSDNLAGKVASVLSSTLLNQTPTAQWGLWWSYTFGVIPAEWFPIGGTWSADGAAKNDTGGSGALLLNDASGMSQDLTVDLSWATGEPDGSVVVRSNGTADAGYVAGLFPNGGATDLRFYRLDAGGALTLVKQFASVPIAGNSCQIHVNAVADVFMVWLDDVPYISASDSTYGSGPYAGLRQGGNPAMRFDNATMRR